MASKFLIIALVTSMSSLALAEHRTPMDGPPMREHDSTFAQPRWLPLSAPMIAQRRNVIRVADDRDELRAIQLVNGSGAVYVYSIDLRYGDGHRENIAVNKWLYARDPRMTFRLPPDHELERIAVRTWSNARSTFQVLGQRSRRIVRPPIVEPPPPLPPTTPTAFLVSKDLTFANTGGSLNLTVGSDKGRFSALRITSTATNTYIGHVHLTFDSGARQTIDINRMLSRGEILDLDLDGGQRAVSSIMVMQSHDGTAYGAGRFELSLLP